jgi:putative endonuclease
MERHPAVYILASKRNGTLYIGVTSDLPARVWQHQNDKVEGFTRQHSVHLLVYYETDGTMIAAITREKQLKRWKRYWKLNLIERRNPHWRNLAAELRG